LEPIQKKTTYLKEGKTGVDDAIKFMSEQEPLPALKWSDELW
jgi:hypothetical protein